MNLIAHAASGVYQEVDVEANGSAADVGIEDELVIEIIGRNDSAHLSVVLRCDDLERGGCLMSTFAGEEVDGSISASRSQDEPLTRGTKEFNFCAQHWSARSIHDHDRVAATDIEIVHRDAPLVKLQSVQQVVVPLSVVIDAACTQVRVLIVHRA